MEKNITLNKEQRLFVIPQSHGYSCLGFDVCQKWANALAEELNKMPLTFKQERTDEEWLGVYTYYRELVAEAWNRNKANGWRSKSQLHPQLIGLENRRVEVEDYDGNVYRFNVGKSTGVIPIHLQIHNKRSHGGPAVDSRPFRRVTVIR